LAGGGVLDGFHLGAQTAGVGVVKSETFAAAVAEGGAGAGDIGVGGAVIGEERG